MILDGSAPHVERGTPPGDAASSPISRTWDPPAPGRSCTDYTFEGFDDLQPIPPLDGFTLPGWYSTVDLDAGGTGNSAFEPSPETTADYYPNLVESGYSDSDIIFDEPVSEFSFYFAAAQEIRVTAYDETNNPIAYKVGAVNFDMSIGDPHGGYSHWDPMRIVMPGNTIKRVVVFASSNWVLIDDLRVCRNIEIAGVEFTQAVQLYQPLADLQADLAADGQPPIPIVARKPMAVRVYVNELNKSADLRVRVSGDVPTRTSSLQTMQINCSVLQQRLGSSLNYTNTCRSLDVLTIPPPNAWIVKVELLSSDDTVLDEETFVLASVATETLNLSVSPICVRRNAGWPWTCSEPTQLPGLLSLLERVVPTDLVTARQTDTTIAKSCDTLDDNDDGLLEGDIDIEFWTSVTDDLASARTWDEALLELSDVVDTRGFGLVPTAMNRNAEPRDNCRHDISGMASDIGGRGAASLDLKTFGGVPITAETVAHETAHMLNSEHTETEDNYQTSAPPGCFNISGSDNPAATPFTNVVGYDVWDSANPIRPSYDPTRNVGYFDLMSYCSPRWVSVRTYQAMLSALQVGTGSPVRFDAPPPYYGQFWKISGSLNGAAVEFDPLFRVAATGTNDPGAGDYQLQVRDPEGAVLFSRAFTPDTAILEESSEPPIVVFSELIPVQIGEVDIVLRDPTSTIIGTIPLSGWEPVVHILTSPSGVLSGEQEFTWTVNDGDGGTHTAWVQYSPNGDAQGEWLNLITDLDTNSFSIDFDRLPGSANNGWIRVYVSDGVNTGSDMVGPFGVAYKTPSVEIQNPLNGAYVSGSGVTLVGGGYDVDDGYLDDSTLQWTSSVDGALGTGHMLVLGDLTEGSHTVSLSGQDSSGSVAVSSPVTFTVDRTPPELDIDFIPDSNWPGCTILTVTASDAISGLEHVQWSQDGGVNWTDLPTDLLDTPYVVGDLLGTGYSHVIVTAVDRVGNVRSRDGQIVLIQPPCNPGINAGMTATVLLQGRPTNPSPLNIVPLLFDVCWRDQPFCFYIYWTTVNERGEAPLQYFDAGTYRFWIKHDQSLATLQEVTLPLGYSHVDFGTLRMGDANNSNSITILDFAIVAATFGKSQGEAGYDARADFNGDGVITIVDFSILASNFGQTGATQPG